MSLKLTDIVNAKRIVETGSGPLEVVGLSVEDIITLLQRFPDAQKLLEFKSGKAEEITKLGPDVLAAIVATATGSTNDREQEDAARRLPVGVLTEIVVAVVEATLPNGIGPFAEKLLELTRAMEGPGLSHGKAPATASLPPSST